MGSLRSDVHFIHVQSKAKKFHDTLSWRSLSPQLSVSYLSTRPYHEFARATYGLVLDLGLLELSSLARVWPAGINMAPPRPYAKVELRFLPDRRPGQVMLLEVVKFSVHGFHTISPPVNVRGWLLGSW